MHPIERLRFVARAEGVPGDVLAIEATAALMTFADDPPALVAGSRRVLSRQLGCGPLWWACTHLLTADRVRDTAGDIIRQLEGDTTDAALSLSIDEDVQVVDAYAIGDGAAIVDAYALEDLDDDVGPRWLVAGVGVHLSDPLWSSLVEHWSPGHRSSEELVPLNRFTHFAGPAGPLPMEALIDSDCPVAPELFKLVG